ncbi:MAG TPA: UDP-2,3-diacylglucosamine diphosphatase [Thermoanaerobaculia bacterium]|nr:UDP-2,3-diacylglucosamine diphosphatase [Thermoanaerobaculia bacterium]
MLPSNQIFVIGDSHIGLTAGSEDKIVSWLDRLKKVQPKALYLNGDVFHYLVATPKFRTSSVANFFAKLRELRNSGTTIHYVEGNRDFFIRGSFVENSVTDVSTEYSVPAGTNRYLVVHGDLINDRDWPYRFWRRASKNPFAKVGVRLTPGPLARMIVDRVEKRLARSNFKHKTRLPIELLERYGVRRGREGFTHVVFGHFHQKLVLPVDGSTVAILPAWYESGEAMMIDPVSGDFSFVVV